ncbi:hypothetical protein [Streptomyces sp. NPDC001652]|uniref:hypothetical protein n=1 Tax=Streptomyces sp. NPDC001652 TaxID=3154393 RepID=UPI0033168558
MDRRRHSERQLTASEVARSRAGQAFTDERLDAAGQLGLAFGLLDLLDDYWVTCEIRFADRGPGGPLPSDVLWDGYRRRLEAPEAADAVTYSLWADWFEDRDTCETAFAEVPGHDAGRLRTDSPKPPAGQSPRRLRRPRPVCRAHRRAQRGEMGRDRRDPLGQSSLFLA